MIAYVDWLFWVEFLIPVAVGLGCGWWLRGEWEGVRQVDREVEWWRLARELEDAKRRHPSHRDVFRGREWQ